MKNRLTWSDWRAYIGPPGYHHVRRLLCAGGEYFRLEHYSESPSMQEEHVLLRVRVVGVCGTDLDILKGRMPGARPPVVLGHEFGGDVIEAGPNVYRVKRAHTLRWIPL